MLKFVVREFYDAIVSNFWQSGGDDVESTMNHTQRNSWAFVSKQADLSLKSIHSINITIEQDREQDYNEFLSFYTADIVSGWIEKDWRNVW